MINIPESIRNQIRESICRPRGTVEFKFTSDSLFNPDASGGKIFEITSGSHLFRIERDRNMHLSFYHSSPGTGTRAASINLNEVKSSKSVFIAFTWEPNGINFYLGPQIPGGKLHKGERRPLSKQLRAGLDGFVYEIGGEGVEVVGTRIYRGNKAVITPTALESWQEVAHSTEVLFTIDTNNNYLRETVLSNSILLMLVTGFESFGKKRFIELEREGIPPNNDDLIKSIFPKKQIERGIPETLMEESDELGLTFIDYIVKERRINFQNYHQSKKVFNATYGIRFGDIDLSSQGLERVQKIIKYRHRIVHVSPLINILNQDQLGTEDPEFPNKELAKESIDLFEKFINKFHELTLTLDR